MSKQKNVSPRDKTRTRYDVNEKRRRPVNQTYLKTNPIVSSLIAVLERRGKFFIVFANTSLHTERMADVMAFVWCVK